VRALRSVSETSKMVRQCPLFFDHWWHLEIVILECHRDWTCVKIEDRCSRPCTKCMSLSPHTRRLITHSLVVVKVVVQFLRKTSYPLGLKCIASELNRASITI